MGKPNRVRRWLAISLAVTALGLPLAAAGCGGDDDEETTAAGGTDTTEATAGGGGGGGGETVQISETDFAIDPSEVTVQPGSVTFDVANDGETIHNLEIEGDGVDEVLPQDLQPGDSGELTVDLQAGSYEMYCPVGTTPRWGWRARSRSSESASTMKA